MVKETQEKIIDAFKDSKYRWRTIYGVSKEVDLSFDEINSFLEESNLFIKARKKNTKGQSLFAYRQKYTKQSPFGIKILNAVTNKIQ